MQKPAELAEKFFGVPYEALDERAKNVARLVAERRHVARDAAKELDDARPARSRCRGGLRRIVDIHHVLYRDHDCLGWLEFAHSGEVQEDF
jgi:hypothetical protein